MISPRAVAVSSEAIDFSQELRQLFLDLNRTPGTSALPGECTPAVDVYETDEAIEVSVDLPAVDPVSVRVVAKGGALLIAGEKAPRRSQGDATFHLVERGYGRFARVVRLGGACDTGRARAALRDGELRITLPKLQERRGRSRIVPVASGPSAA